MLRRFWLSAQVAITAFLVAACQATSEDMGGASSTSGRADAESELVAVPRVTQTSVTEAYKLLHEAGLLVEIPESFSVAALHEPGPAKQTPRAGELVPPRTVVKLRLWSGPLASPAWRPHTVTVPNLVGLTASDALDWIAEADLFFEVRDIPPLLPSDAPRLFDAYKVTAQSPAPGTQLSPGVLSEGGGFLPTPVILSVKGCIRRGLAIACDGGLSRSP